MTKRSAIIFLSVLIFFAILTPALVIIQTTRINSGWHEILWGTSENHVQEWIKKNNNRYSYNRCNFSHFGVTCYKLSWKENETSPFDYIEFQFRDNKLCAVIETERKKNFDPAISRKLGKPKNGTDLSVDYLREKGIRYKISDRVFYYEPIQKLSSTKLRYAVQRYIRTNLNDVSKPDEIMEYQLTTGYYQPDYFEEIKDNTEDFPTFRFF